jgi:hypothetical protein
MCRIKPQGGDIPKIRAKDNNGSQFKPHILKMSPPMDFNMVYLF